MPLFGKEPFDEARATYVWTGPDGPGVFVVAVRGRARNFSSGIHLARDFQFAGGLKPDVLGWTGPLADPIGDESYAAVGHFPGLFVPNVVVEGSNKSEVVTVTEVPYDQADAFLAKQAGAK